MKNSTDKRKIVGSPSIQKHVFFFGLTHTYFIRLFGEKLTEKDKRARENLER